MRQQLPGIELSVVYKRGLLIPAVSVYSALLLVGPHLYLYMFFCCYDV